MQFDSPLMKLIASFQQVREAAVRYDSKLKDSEALTRAVLIDPILNALGWDISNPDMVEVEKRITKESQVDYVLLDSQGEVKIGVEAKKFNDDLNSGQTRRQVAGYTVDLPAVFLTDGANWWHYTDNVKNPTPIGSLLEATDEDLIKMASYFVAHLDAALYWSPQQDIDSLTEQVRNLEDEVEKINRILDEVKQNSNQTSANAKPQSSESTLETDGFVILDNDIDIDDNSPSAIILPDSSRIEITKWKQILIECARYTLKNVPNIDIPFIDSAGKKVNLLSRQQPQIRRSIKLLHGEDKVYLDTNYSAESCIKNALHIIKQLPGQSPVMIKLKSKSRN